MKKIIALVLILTNFNFSAFSQLNFTQNIKNFGSISFPSLPQIKVGKRDTIYLNSGNGFLYFLQLAPLQNNSIVLFGNSNNLDKLYQATIKGTLVGANAQLIYARNIRLKNLIGIEFGYKSIKKDKIYYGYNQVYYLNHTLVNYSIHSINPLDDENVYLKSFFDSFKITSTNLNLIQDDVSETDHIFERIIRWIIFIGILFLIGLTIIFWIKKIKNK